MLVSFSRVIVNNVQNHFDSGPVQFFDHLLEFTHRPARSLVGSVSRLWRKKSNRAVAPVIYQMLARPRIYICIFIFIKFKNRKQLNRRNSKLFKIIKLLGKALVSSRIINIRGRRSRKALEVSFINHRLIHRKIKRLIPLPVKGLVINYNALWKIRKVRKLAGIHAGAAQFIVGTENRTAGKSLCVRIKEIFLRVKAEAGRRHIRPRNLIKVQSTRAQPLDHDMPDISRTVIYRIKFNFYRWLFRSFTIK